MANFLENFDNKSYNGIKATEHAVVIDKNYNKQKTIRIAIICLVVLLISIAAYFVIGDMNNVQVLNFQNKGIAEVKTWALKNSIELDEQYVFNTDVKANTVISQSVPFGRRITKSSVLSLTISKGANPDEKINVPDLNKMTAAQIQAWIDTNKLLNTSILEENSDTVKIGHFIQTIYRDISVDNKNFRRKDYLTITVSKGPSSSEAGATMPDFTGKDKGETGEWASKNNIIINYITQISTIVPIDKIISQNNETGSKVQSGSTISLVVSGGAGIVVPDFSKIPMGSAPAANPQLVVVVKMQYKNNVPYGNFISQSVKAGKRVPATENKIEVVYSEGIPYIGNLKGTYEKDLATYFYAYIDKGANITYNITYEDSTAEKGSIISTSKYNQFLSLSEKIEIKVSKGNLTPSPLQPQSTPPPQDTQPPQST